MNSPIRPKRDAHEDGDVERLAIAIAKALQQARSVSDSEHFDHHAWITKRIAREEERIKFWTQMREHAAKWGIISVLSGLFYAMWLGIVQMVAHK